MSPTVSIIVPFYNRLDYLKETLVSIKRQSNPEFEVLVVDDYSNGDIKDAIRDFLLEVSDRRFKLLQSDREKGASGARNTGLWASKGKYIIFLDSDDLLNPFCLERRIDKMENSFLDFAVFPMLLFGDKTEKAEYLWNSASPESDLDRFLKLDSVWQTSGPIWRKEFLIGLGGFDEKLTCWQDVDIHIRALMTSQNYKKFYEMAPDCYYRKNSKNSISQQGINSPEKLKSRFSFVQKLERSGIRNRDIRFVCANLIVSSLDAGNVNFFLKVYFWANNMGIFHFVEKVKFIQLAIIILPRLHRIKLIYRYKGMLMKKIIPKSQIGKIRYVPNLN